MILAIGIDPGKPSGIALAGYRPSGSSAGVFASAECLPTAKEMTAVLRDMRQQAVLEHGTLNLAVIERPWQGDRTSARKGVTTEIILGRWQCAIEMAGLTWEVCEPHEWRGIILRDPDTGEMYRSGAAWPRGRCKRVSCEIAGAMVGEKLRVTKDHNRADACLIACYAAARAMALERGNG